MQKYWIFLVINELYFLHLYLSVYLLNWFLWTHQTTNKQKLRKDTCFSCSIPPVKKVTSMPNLFGMLLLVSFHYMSKIEMLLNCRKMITVHYSTENTLSPEHYIKKNQPMSILVLVWGFLFVCFVIFLLEL